MRKLTRQYLPVAAALLCFAGRLAAAEIEGFTEPYQTIDVAAIESGIITELQVKEGDLVSPDQPLAQLNQDVLRASLEIARAGRDATSILKSAEAELRLRADRLQKLEELRLTGNASQEEVQRAALDRELAEARVLAAREELEIKRLEYERIRIQVERRTVNSPIAGFVTQVYREVGEFVAPTEPVVMTVVQLDPLVVVFPVPATDAIRLKKGNRASVRIDGQKKPVAGDIEVVSPVINAESQTVRVRVRIPNPGFAIQSGAKAWFDPLGSEKTTQRETPAAQRQ